MPSTLGIVAAANQFLPISPTDLVAWYDASDLSTFSFSSGSVVSQWRDKSENARHLEQTTNDARPSRSTTLNGLPTVAFDGVDDFLLSVSFSTVAQPLHFYAAFRLPVDAASDGDLLGSVSPRTVIRPKWGGGSPAGTLALMFAGSTGLTRARLLAGSYIWGVYFSGSNSTNRLNAVSGTTGSAGTSGIGQFRVGRRGDGDIYLNVELAEMLIVRRLLSAVEIADIEAYLNAKWAIY